MVGGKLVCLGLSSGIVVRRAVESVLPKPFVPCLVGDKLSFVIIIFGWMMGAKMS